MGINLLKETLEVMQANGLKTKDVDWIGSQHGTHVCFDWSEFEALANQNYNNKTMTYKVAYDLIIVFKNGIWLERHHDISGERWVIRVPPKYKGSKLKIIKSLFGNDQTLETIHMLLKKDKKTK